METNDLTEVCISGWLVIGRLSKTCALNHWMQIVSTRPVVDAPYTHNTSSTREVSLQVEMSIHTGAILLKGLLDVQHQMENVWTSRSV